MIQSDAKITVERIESLILVLKPERSPESLTAIEQIELFLVALKAEIEKELPTVPPGPAV